MESQGGQPQKKKTKKKKKKTIKKMDLEVPDFELAEIMGEFEIDDLGNFIILRGERGELLDKRERRVNRRGYLIDRFGNVINKEQQVIFKALELDSDDEIPAPFGFEKRKKNLMSIGEGEADFRVRETEKQVPDDEDLIERELQAMRKSGKRLRKDGSSVPAVEEAPNEGDESSVDSLMAESPAKYANKQEGVGLSQIDTLSAAINEATAAAAANVSTDAPDASLDPIPRPLSIEGLLADNLIATIPEEDPKFLETNEDIQDLRRKPLHSGKNEEELLDKLTQMKVPIKKPQTASGVRVGGPPLPHVKNALTTKNNRSGLQTAGKDASSATRPKTTTTN